MDEYIEREAFIKDVQLRLCNGCDSHNGVKCKACWVDDMIGEIMSADSADVVDARHGEWIRCDAILFDNEVVWYKCSKCNTTWGACNNYCPNCGAKMDGKGEG